MSQSLKQEWARSPEGLWAIALTIAWARECWPEWSRFEEAVDDALVEFSASGSHDARRLLRALGPFRTVARQVMRDFESVRRLPTYWTKASILARPGGRWEARIGWGATTYQVGEWHSVDDARAVLEVLRPHAHLTIHEQPH